MNQQQILDKVRAVFPYLEIKESDIETQRHRIMRDFYFAFVAEFQVDLDHITRVQLCQRISGDDDMIPTINLMCCINALIPGPPVGLFELVTPSQHFMWKKMSLCLRYYDFSDTITSALYDKCNDVIKSKKAIKQYTEGIAELNRSTNDILKRVKNESGMIVEAEVALQNVESENRVLIDEKRATEHKIQEVIARKELLLRKKQQATAALNDLKRKLDMRKNKLNSDDQFQKLEVKMIQVKEKNDKYMGLIDDERKSHLEMSTLNTTLANRCKSVEEILQACLKIKELEILLKEKESAKLNSTQVDELNNINEDISKVQEENDQLIVSNAREIEQLQNSIERKKKFEDNSSKLCKLKSEFKDIQDINNKIMLLRDKETKLKQSFLKEETRLKKMEANLANEARRKCEMYLTEANSILEDATSLHQM